MVSIFKFLALAKMKVNGQQQWTLIKHLARFLICEIMFAAIVLTMLIDALMVTCKKLRAEIMKKQYTDPERATTLTKRLIPYSKILKSAISYRSRVRPVLDDLRCFDTMVSCSELHRPVDRKDGIDRSRNLEHMQDLENPDSNIFDRHAFGTRGNKRNQGFPVVTLHLSDVSPLRLVPF